MSTQVRSQERGEPCGCLTHAALTTEGLNVGHLRCPLHAAAPDLLAALEGWIAQHEAASAVIPAAYAPEEEAYTKACAAVALAKRESK